jgi:hypothetical protein
MTWWQKFKDFWITDSTKPVEENPDDYETVRARKIQTPREFTLGSLSFHSRRYCRH